MGSKTNVEKCTGLITGLAIAEMLSTGQLQIKVRDNSESKPHYTDNAFLGPVTRALCDQPTSAFEQMLDETPGLRDLLYLMAIDTPRPQLLSTLLSRIHPLPAMEQSLHRIGHVIGWGSELRAIKHIRASGIDDDALPLSLYYMLRYDEAPIEGVMMAAQTTESRRIAHIVGMAIGLQHGIHVFPQVWRHGLPQYALLIEIATANADHWIDILSKQARNS